MSLPPCPHWPPWLIPPLFRLLPPLQTSQPAPGTTEIPKIMIGVLPSFCAHRLKEARHSGHRVGNSVPPCLYEGMDGWGRTVQIGAWSLAADTERADPAPWLHRQRSRTDVGLSSTTSPKSARRGCRMVTLLLAIFSLLRALGAVPIDPFDVVLRGRTSPCRSNP